MTGLVTPRVTLFFFHHETIINWWLIVSGFCSCLDSGQVVVVVSVVHHKNFWFARAYIGWAS